MVGFEVRQIPLRPVWWVGIFIVAGWLWLFRGPLLSGNVIALRDAGNFYYPLFGWQSAEWSAGRIPLWNPYDGLGMPALADATSSSFYPGKLIFTLPIGLQLRFNLYIALHVLFAAWSLYFVARRWNASEVAAGVGAISYAFGGYVLFQHCNVVYLVSAGWLPLSIWLGESLLVSRRPGPAIALGATLALMTLGGDPQTAYHGGLVVALYGVLIWWSERRERPLPSMFRRHLFRSRPVLLGLAGCSTFGFAAVQVVPTWDWARRSNRAEYELPRSIYEVASIPQWLAGEQRRDNPPTRPIGQAEQPTAMERLRRGLFATPLAGTHARRTYYYSVGPWRIAELVWPNLAGRMFPTHRRWLSAVPGEGRVWTPTLYVGLVSMIAAACACRWRQATPRDRWLIALVAIGIGGSCGWYGVGWLIHEWHAAWQRSPAPEAWIGQPVGGLYWWCVTLLPGYAYFRYPAKWFVFTALGVSLLAARGTDRLLAGDPRARHGIKAVAVCSLTLVAAAVVGRTPFLKWLQAAQPDDLFGPLDAAGAWIDVVSAMLHVTVVSVLIGWLLRTLPRHKSATAAGLLALSAVDLIVANHWLVVSVDKSLFEHDSRAAALIREIMPTIPGEPPLRAIHDPHIPQALAAWSQQRSEQRVAEIVAWERHALFSRHHLLFRIALLDAPSTIRPAQWSERLVRLQSGPFEWLHDRPAARIFLPRPDVAAATVGPQGGSGPESGLRVERHVPAPHAWFHPDDSASSAGSTSTCTLKQYEPQRVEIAVAAKAAGEWVTKDLADAGWVAEIRENDGPRNWIAPTTAVDGLFRGVRLPAGSYTIVLRYQPRRFYYGFSITAAMLVICAARFGIRTISSRYRRTLVRNQLIKHG